MTIPVIPGPFSFLAEAGQAVGQVGQAIQARRERKVAEAQKGLENVLALVTAGRLDPSVLNSPEVQGLFQQARTPTGGAQLQPSADDLLRQARTRALGTLQPGGAAEAAVTGVPREPVAGAAERTTLAGAGRAEAEATVAGEQARVAPAQADAAITEARTRQTVFEGAQTTLGDPKNPLFRRLAQEAALGILPVRLQQMESNRQNLSLERQAMADYARLLISSLGDINQTYRSLHTAWGQGLQQAVTAGELQNRKREEVVAEYIRDFGPEPSYEDVRNEYLKSNLGLTIDQYHEQIRRVIPLLEGRGEGRRPPPGQQAKPKSKIGATVGAILENPSLDRIAQLANHALAGRYSSGELTAIKAQLQGKVKPEVMQALDELLQRIIAAEERAGSQ